MYDCHARYSACATELLCSARVAEDVVAAITNCALTAHAALDPCGLPRTDVVIDVKLTVRFLEVNVAPGTTETALIRQALAAPGLSLGEVFAWHFDESSKWTGALSTIAEY